MFTTGQLPPNFPRFQTRKALFVLELQNDFLSADGKLPVNTCRGFVDNIRSLVPVFRGLGDIVWVRSEFDELSVTADPPEIEEVFSSKDTPLSIVGGGEDDGHDSEGKNEGEDEHCAQVAENDAEVHSHRRSHGGASSRSQSRSASSAPSDRVQGLPHRTSTRVKGKPDELLAPWPTDPSGVRSRLESPERGLTTICCVPGSWGAEFVDDIKPTISQQNDRLVVKSCFSAFDDTSLLLLLRSSFVTELYICGSRSHASVHATAADAVRHGFSITIVEDCLGYREEARHMEAMRQMADVMGADGITSTELIEEITGASPKQEDPEEDKESLRGTAHSAKLETALKEHSRSVSAITVSDFALEDGSVFAESLPTKAGGAGMTGDSHQESELSTTVRTTMSTSFTLAETQQQVDSDVGVKASTTRLKIGLADSDAQTAGQNARDKSDVLELSTASSNELGNKPKTSKNRSERLPTMRRGQTTSKSVIVEGTGETLLSNASKKSQLASASPEPGSRVISASTYPEGPDSFSSSVQLDQAVRTNVAFSTLGPNDEIGEGDSHIVYDILSKAVADDMFRHVREEVRWQKMYHRTGEVPRLVAVQGEVGQDGSVPVYRHPADESPPLQIFSPMVSRIRDVAAKILQQPLNHVLIQLYRDGQDNISEHSDKTLDIVHGSRIANVSFGAQRIMTLRTKRPARESPPSKTSTRQTQRVPLPHNSMFVLGQKTNMRWLHGVRPDKRPSTEKSTAELAFSGERISLTFRHIGTFLNHDLGRIWGQGACSKSKSDAGKIVKGDAAEIENMIRAFGEENQQSHFDWEGAYGSGFNVLNFVTRSSKLYESDDGVSDLRVKLYLAEIGTVWRLEKAKSRKVPEHAADQLRFGVKLQPKFVDVDPEETEIEGDLPILFYLNRFYDEADYDHSSSRTEATSARAFSRVSQAERLLNLWRRITDASSERGSQRLDGLGTQLLTEELQSWESCIAHNKYIAGEMFSIADCALWPILKEIIQKWKSWSVDKFPNLTRYHELVLQRAIDAKIL